MWRAVCRYEKFADRFIRVAFANESLTGLSHTELSVDVEERLRGILHGDGLRICNRNFKFLGYSNSQLKDHSCWLYCDSSWKKDGAPSAAEIREAAGMSPSLQVFRAARCIKLCAWVTKHCRH